MFQITTYIVVHDQRIVEAFESSAKCSVLGNYNYLFVGERDVSKVRHLRNLIVVRELTNNIEEHKNLVSLTAWYATSRNKLCNTSHVAFLDYDNLFSNRMLSESISAIERYPTSLIGYFEGSLSKEGLYLCVLHGAETLNAALEQAYSVKLDQLVLADIKRTQSVSWPKCSAFLMPTTMLDQYIDWITPMIPQLASSKKGGHAAERSLKAFAMHQQVDTQYLTGLLEHLQLDSHRTTFGFHEGEQGYEKFFIERVAYLASTKLP